MSSYNIHDTSYKDVCYYNKQLDTLKQQYNINLTSTTVTSTTVTSTAVTNGHRDYYTGCSNSVFAVECINQQNGEYTFGVNVPKYFDS